MCRDTAGRDARSAGPRPLRRRGLNVLIAACAASACTAWPEGGAGAGTAGAPAELLAALRADAAQRAGVPASAVRVASVEAVTWRDGSLGCPQPGLAYTQALIPGWWATLVAGDRRLRYHAAAAGRWLWCPDDRAQPPLPGGAAR